MATSKTGSRRGLVWALAGGVVLVAGIVAIMLATIFAQQPDASHSSSPSPSYSATDQPSDTPVGGVVDASVVERGWTPEPITTDADDYIRAALAAASTFDTQKSSRTDWLAYLDTWFTPDTRYASSDEREADMRASQLELRQAVVLPEELWGSLANETGRVVAVVPGEIVDSDVPSDTADEMRIGTADVVLTFTRSDVDGNETAYDEQVRVSVQVLCGDGSIPTPGTEQQPGDCKVVRYFSGPLEP